MTEIAVAPDQPLTEVMPVGLDTDPPRGLMTRPVMETRLSVSHVADFYRRYPGETVTFYTRVDILKPLPGFKLQISLPPELTPGAQSASANHGDRLPEFVVEGENRYIIWTVERDLRAGEQFEYTLETQIAPTENDLMLECRALVIVSDLGAGRIVAGESAEIAVKAKGSYLKYLPALYYDDELMGRYLMLFESFWGPIDRQIDQLYRYFDPKLTPIDFLPWLALWLDLALDERWPEARRRLLVSSAASLYRKRGTPQGLREYLEIYTGRTPQIIEHRAHNFRLGLASRLGPSVALGKVNMPHTFTVILRLPPIEDKDEGAASRKELERRRTIESIIESEKPAHTAYTLRLESPEARTGQAAA